MLPEAQLLSYHDEDMSRPVLLWQAPARWRALSTALHGGGLAPIQFWVNAMVNKEYHRSDPAAHVHEIAAQLGVAQPNEISAGIVGMLTAAKVQHYTQARRADCYAVSTVGLGWPTWAAVTDEQVGDERAYYVSRAADAEQARYQPGTINILVAVDRPISDAALVNAVVTATEAKTQALIEAGVPGTGTASDAIVIACPDVVVREVAETEVAEREEGHHRASFPEPVAYAGPRSPLGLQIAQAVHQAVAEGTRAWLASHQPA